MDEKHVQIIEPSPIQLVARRIDSVSFDGGVSAPEQSKVKGKCNFTNRISKVDSQEDGTDYFYVTVTVSVKPDEGYSYYSLDMSVTGVFVAADRNMDRGALE